jgi:hypothetical protein
MDSFISGKDYTNRYKDTYRFLKESDTVYTFQMDGNSMQYCRFAGKDNIPGIDSSDYGMVDPSGGPYMSVGEMTIDGRNVIRIFSTETGIGLEVK